MRNLLLLCLFVTAGLAGCVSDDDQDRNDMDSDFSNLEGVLAAAPTVDAAALLADLESFAGTFPVRRANEPTHEGARQELASMFEDMGLEVYRQEFTDGSNNPLEQANIMGIKWGADRDDWVIVGGHYDSFHDDCIVTGALNGAGVPVPHCPIESVSEAAYDNVAGTMMTMHLAKAFAGTVTPYTIAFVAFDGEERGTQGARAFVESFITGHGGEELYDTPYGKINTVGVLNLDMIGLNWPGVMAPITVHTNSNDLMAETRAKASDMGFPDEQISEPPALQLGSSDFARFWEVPDGLGGPIPTVFYSADFENLGLPAPAPPQAHTPTEVPLAYPFWHLVDTYETMLLMAGGQQANLDAGFESAANLGAHIVWRFATDPSFDPDAVVR